MLDIKFLWIPSTLLVLIYVSQIQGQKSCEFLTPGQPEGSVVLTLEEDVTVGELERFEQKGDVASIGFDDDHPYLGFNFDDADPNSPLTFILKKSLSESLDDDNKTEQSLGVTVNCEDGFSSTIQFVVRITDINNKPPVFNSPSPYQLEVTTPWPTSIPINVKVPISTTDDDFTKENTLTTFTVSDERVSIVPTEVTSDTKPKFGYTLEIFLNDAFLPDVDNFEFEISAENDGLEAKASVIVTVKKENIYPPKFSRSLYKSIPIDALPTEGSDVPLELPIEASDAEMSPFQYEVGGENQNFVKIDPKTAKLQFQAIEPGDVEMLQNGVAVIEVIAREEGESSLQSVATLLLFFDIPGEETTTATAFTCPDPSTFVTEICTPCPDTPTPPSTACPDPSTFVTEICTPCPDTPSTPSTPSTDPSAVTEVCTPCPDTPTPPSTACPDPSTFVTEICTPCPDTPSTPSTPSTDPSGVTEVCTPCPDTSTPPSTACPDPSTFVTEICTPCPETPSTPSTPSTDPSAVTEVCTPCPDTPTPPSTACPDPSTFVTEICTPCPDTPSTPSTPSTDPSAVTEVCTPCPDTPTPPSTACPDPSTFVTEICTPCPDTPSTPTTPPTAATEPCTPCPEPSSTSTWTACPEVTTSNTCPPCESLTTFNDCECGETPEPCTTPKPEDCEEESNLGFIIGIAVTSALFVASVIIAVYLWFQLRKFSPDLEHLIPVDSSGFSPSPAVERWNATTIDMENNENITRPPGPIAHVPSPKQVPASIASSIPRTSIYDPVYASLNSEPNTDQAITEAVPAVVLSDRPPSPKPDYRTKPDYAVKILDYVEVIPADQPQEQGSSGKSEREKKETKQSHMGGSDDEYEDHL